MTKVYNVAIVGRRTQIVRIVATSKLDAIHLAARIDPAAERVSVLTKVGRNAE